MDGTSQPAAASVPLSTPLRDQDVLRRLSVHLECVQVEQVMVADLGWAAGGESKPFSAHTGKRKWLPRGTGHLDKQERAEKDVHGQTGNSPS